MTEDRSRKIRDPIHNYIKLGTLETRLMDTPQFQRLRYVRQLGLNYLVYPGANHSRFEHSLGVYHLARACVEEIGLEDYLRRVLSTAALLHDLGHGPFSHVSDTIFKLHGTSHEEFSLKQIREGGVGTILEQHGIDPGDVCSVLQKNHKFSSLITSQLDVDKMDYLVRDAHYTGVAIGADLGRIVNTHRLVGEKIAISDTSLPAVESLLISRYIMYPSVYNHRTARIAERMLLRAFELSLQGEVGGGREGISLERLEKLQQMKDVEFLTHLQESCEKADLMVQRVLQRKLLKTAFELPFERVGEEEAERVNGIKREFSQQLEERIAHRFSIPKDLVIIDVPGFSITGERPLYIVTKGNELKTVNEVSRLAAILAHAQYDHWKIRLFLPERFRDIKATALEKIFEEFLELRHTGSQRSLHEFE